MRAIPASLLDYTGSLGPCVWDTVKYGTHFGATKTSDTLRRMDSTLCQRRLSAGSHDWAMLIDGAVPGAIATGETAPAHVAQSSVRIRDGDTARVGLGHGALSW